MNIGEGYKRNRNVVSLANSDPAVIKLVDRWIPRLTSPPDLFRFQRKSNSGSLNGRSWRSVHGALTVV
jgi:hypothetical protein